MKKILLVLATGLSLHLSAQQYPMYSRGMALSYSDPAVSDLKFTTAGNTAANTDQLPVGTPVKMSFTISNKEPLNAVPAGTIQVKITLGSKFKLANELGQMSQLPLNEYFRWTADMAPRNSQLILTGELIEDLPARYVGVVSFNLLPTREGSSTITSQVMISNNNPVTILSDILPGNNYVSKTYTNSKSIALNFVQFGAIPHNCAVDMSWLIADVDKQARRFIIETSNDGTNFISVQTILATGASSYGFTLNNVSSKNLTVRVKAETNTGSLVYSKPVLVSNICGGHFDLGLFPNPLAKEVKEVTITAKEGVFNGKYGFQLVDAAGKEISRTEMTLNNQVSVKYNTGIIASGTYFINIKGEDGQAASLPFVKQ